MDKDDINIIHMYTVILLSHNKEQNAICSNMDGPGYCQQKKEVRKKKEKYHMTLLICVILRKLYK